jgi:uncharacterized protein YjdB
MASCGTFSATTKAVTGTLTINASPAALITPTTTVCVGSSIYLSDVTAGGVWTSSNTNMATVDAQGHVFAVSAGSPVISYTLGICAATAIVKVNAPPGPIFGPSSEVCQSGGLLSLGDPIAGGTWSSSATAQATVDPVSGVVTAVAPGVTNINYFTGACPTVTYSVTVDPLPSVITGVNAVCENATIFLSDVTANGTWSSSNTNLATVDPNTGKVSGVSAASVTISYILPTGCFVTKAITVNPAPSVILGSAAVCEGSTIRLSDATAGGTWSSANSSRAAIGSLTGIVTGNTAGSVNISYSVPVTQCFAILPLTVAPVPTAITGNNSVCKGAQGYLSDAVGGGDWSSQTTTVATIDPVSGTVYGVTAGSDVITYMIGGTGCKVVYTYSVNPLPTAVITAGGPTTFCPGPGGSVTLTAGPAGMTYQWYSNGNPVATGSTYTSTSTELITLQVTDGNGCSNTTSPGTQVTLIPNITISAAGPTVFCQPYNVLLSVPLAVGLQYQWKLNGVNIPGANSNTYYASQGGTYTDSVWVPGGCSVVTPPFTVIVHPMPTPVVFYTGTQLVTATGFITYQWFLNSIAIPGATTNAVTPLVNGTYIIRVVDGNGCMGYSNGFAMNNLGVEILTNTDIKIYPNPANSLVHIESPVNVRAVITGMEGQTVMEVNNAAEVNISKLPDGLYMILLYDKKGDRLLVQKLIKE